jgi:predicted Zn-dependent protease
MNLIHRTLTRLSTCALLTLAMTGCQQQQPTVQPRDDAAKVAAIQKQQQDAAAQSQHDADLKKQIERNEKKSNSFYVAKSKTWQKYIP